MRYIDLRTQEEIENAEPTYNEAQIFGILVSVVGIVGILAFGTLSLVSAL